MDSYHRLSSSYCPQLLLPRSLRFLSVLWKYVQCRGPALVNAIFFERTSEYNGIGTGAVFGHIRSAVNVPIDDVFGWHDQRWLNTSELVRIFADSGLHPSKPVIVYCSTSVRSSMIWFALRKCNYNATIYFGSWPEWLIRAPDFLKIIPERRRA
ncbi:unnamed protein product [Toxocara canis]|uniref:Rhodanese domain-containing protein n=1 Tax=Toxocara canis TaxID=6265 RepID=A0A183U2X7_TOXCA|nr:unnamed protein product [Toxocara canis]